MTINQTVDPERKVTLVRLIKQAMDEMSDDVRVAREWNPTLCDAALEVEDFHTFIAKATEHGMIALGVPKETISKLFLTVVLEDIIGIAPRERKAIAGLISPWLAMLEIGYKVRTLEELEKIR